VAFETVRIVEELVEIWLNEVCDKFRGKVVLVPRIRLSPNADVRRMKSSNYSGDK